MVFNFKNNSRDCSILAMTAPIWLLISFIFFAGYSFSQCVSSGAHNPSVAANNTSIGAIAWVSPNSIFSSNNARSNSTALLFGDVSNYLFATGFNFSIPSTAIICGITVEIEKSASGIITNIQDNSIRLIKEGVVVGSNYAVGGAWPGSDSYFTHGGTSDLWGTTWTPVDINSPNFGIAISANLSGSLLLPSARIDHIRITVQYDNTLPIELINFTGLRENNRTAKLTWQTASELNNDSFTIERSQDGEHWNSVGKVKGQGNSSTLVDYSFSDDNQSNVVSYYRLKQTDYDGRFSYSEPISIEASEINEIQIYPNPTSDLITITTKKEIAALQLFNSIGVLVKTWSFDCTERVHLAESYLSELEKGTYTLQIIDCEGNKENKKVLLY